MNPSNKQANASHGRFGKLSFACAAGACVLLMCLAYIAQVKESSIFALHDANAVLWLTWLAFLLAYGAVALALYAEYRREPTLYPAASFVVAATSVGLLQPTLMLFTGMTGAGLLFAIRRERTARPS